MLVFPLRDFHAEFVHWSCSLFHCWKDLWNLRFWWCYIITFYLAWISMMSSDFPPLNCIFSLYTGRNVKGQGWGRSGMGSMAMFVVKNCRMGTSFWAGTLCCRNQFWWSHLFVAGYSLFKRFRTSLIICSLSLYMTWCIFSTFSSFQFDDRRPPKCKILI